MPSNPSAAHTSEKTTGHSAVDAGQSLRGFAIGALPDCETARRLRKRRGGLASLFLLTLALASLFSVAAPYKSDFTAAEVGSLPKDMQRINGNFAVATFEGKKVLELPGEPLDTFGVLFGPADHADLDVRANVWSAASGRRFPEFGVGAGDVGGYKLLVLPGQKKVELRKGDDVAAAAEMRTPWKSAAWTAVRLRVSKAAEGRWKVEGKSWPADAPEPPAWDVSHEVSEAPSPGRASVWGVPFSGQPLRFGDLVAGPASVAK